MTFCFYSFKSSLWTEKQSRYCQSFVSLSAVLNVNSCRNGFAIINVLLCLFVFVHGKKKILLCYVMLKISEAVVFPVCRFLCLIVDTYLFWYCLSKMSTCKLSRRVKLTSIKRIFFSGGKKMFSCLQH